MSFLSKSSFSKSALMISSLAPESKVKYLDTPSITNLILNEKDSDFYNLIIDINVNDNMHISDIVKSLDGLPVVEAVNRFIG